uniref:deoxyribonuclease II n=1 Tax=Maylandia zebra TaxID=106582 RepID=A0A3P9AXY5_9CICH
FDYVYTDSTNHNLRKTNKDVNNQAGVLLLLFSDHSADVLFLIMTCALSCSCSAGVVMIDEDNVVWLLHSTPRFPFSHESNNFYPKSGERNAQIFMCVTLKSTESEEIGKSMSKLFLHTCGQLVIRSLNAFFLCEIIVTFCSFPTKELRILFTRFGDLYVTIADTLNTNLYIQTWCNDPNNADKRPPSVTGKGKELVTIMSVDTAAGKWNRGCDHSKWCVSETENWMCVGDSNREPSQFERPGGALCINSKPVAEKFREIKKLSVKTLQPVIVG